MGDYRIQNVLGDGFGVSEGVLHMDGEDGYVKVLGGFHMVSGSVSAPSNVFSCISNRNCFTRGVLEVQGDFIQSEGNPYNFQAEYAHEVILSGGSKQVVSFNNPGSSYFWKLAITNPSTTGVEFDTSVRVNELFNHNRKAFILRGSNNSFVDYDDDGLLDNVDPFPTEPNNVDSPPLAPTLLSPTNDEVVPAQSVIVLSFGAVTDADLYQVQVYDSVAGLNTFNDGNVSTSVCSNGTCSLEIPGMEAQEGASWRVRARSGSNNWSQWSARATFGVEAILVL